MSDDSTKQEFLTELESIIESDEAYGSNIQVLTYSIKNEIINGKFKDYEFIIDLDGVSYKPAAKLDSFSEDELPARFDSYSEGYGSLFENIRLDRNPISKRIKKPKCGAEGYGCGYSCIGLQKTCRILGSGKKAGTDQGKAIGKERLIKLMDKAKALAKIGDTKGLALAKSIIITIEEAREKHYKRGVGKILERKSIKQQGKTPIVKQPPESLSLGPNKDMSGFDLHDLDLSGMSLKAGNFSGSNLENSDFSGTNLASVNFKGSYLRRVNFSQSNIDGADFTGADITDADFTGVNLKNVDLSKAIGYDPKKHSTETVSDRDKETSQRKEERKRKAEQSQVKTPARPVKQESAEQNETREFPNKNTQTYYDTLQTAINKGTLSSETKQNIKDYVEWLYTADYNSKENLGYKQERILKEMKDEPEAAFALAAYIHGPSFRNMNAVLWRKDTDKLNEQINAQENRSSDEFTKQYIALDVGATKALKALPALSRDALKEEYKDYEIDTEKFRRYMFLPEGSALNNFLKDHKPGETIEYHSFQSCTVFPKEDATPEIAAFSESANVKYTLTRKEDTQAKAMDKFKNQAIEGEVLYPPGTKFKVTKVEEVKSEKFDFYPFSSISKSKKDQKKTAAFIAKIPQTEWDSYVENIRDYKLKEVLTNIRNKDPKSFNDDFKFFANTRDYAESKNLLFLMLEKAGVKLDKSPGASKYHVHMEEI